MSGVSSIQFYFGLFLTLQSPKVCVLWWFDDGIFFGRIIVKLQEKCPFPLRLVSLLCDVDVSH